MTGNDRERTTATDDLGYIRDVLLRTQQRIDPHAFHFILWGAIVLVWYPAANILEHQDRLDLAAVVGGVSFLLGMGLSSGLEFRLRRRSRLTAENTFVGRQIGWIVFACIAAGILISAAGPAFGFIEGREVPVIWGLVYAALAFMVGVVYSPEYKVAGAAIFCGAIAAMAVPAWNGVILGPVMGLGMIIPGLMAERRVRALREESIVGS